MQMAVYVYFFETTPLFFSPPRLPLPEPPPTVCEHLVCRRYPQIYASEEKLLLDAKSIKVRATVCVCPLVREDGQRDRSEGGRERERDRETESVATKPESIKVMLFSVFALRRFSPQVTRSHFLGALLSLTPSSQREGINPARPLPPHLSALLSDSLEVMSETLKVEVCLLERYNKNRTTAPAFSTMAGLLLMFPNGGMAFPRTCECKCNSLLGASSGTQAC